MKQEYKQAYTAPQAELFELKQSMNVLEDFSVKAEVGEPEYGDTWGDIDDQHWGRYDRTRNNPAY